MWLCSASRHSQRMVGESPGAPLGGAIVTPCGPKEGRWDKNLILHQARGRVNPPSPSKVYGLHIVLSGYLTPKIVENYKIKNIKGTKKMLRDRVFR